MVEAKKHHQLRGQVILDIPKKRERTIWCGNIVHLRRPVCVYEIDVLLDRHVVERIHEQIVVMHVDDGPNQAAGKREEFSGIGGSKPVRHNDVSCGRVLAHRVVSCLVILGHGV